MKKYEGFCPIRHILDRIGDKWSILVMLTLEKNGIMRFGELNNEIPDVSQKMLTTTLRTLVTDGYVERKAYAVAPPRVEYKLTDMGQSLIPHISSLVNWALDHKDNIVHMRSQAV